MESRLKTTTGKIRFAPKKVLFKWGGLGMNVLFVLFAVVYSLLLIQNIIS